MKTLNNNMVNELIIKKSRFVSFSFVINSNDEIDSILSNLKKEHKNAKHICYSFSFINQNNVLEEGYFESTEPSGTSGKQIYNLLKKLNLINVLIVVVRYFGNIKLGVGLLSRSYLDAAKNVINNSMIIDFIPREEITIRFQPDKFQYVINFIKQNNILIKKRNNAKLEFVLLIPKGLNINELLRYIGESN